MSCVNGTGCESFPELRGEEGQGINWSGETLPADPEDRLEEPGKRVDVDRFGEVAPEETRGGDDGEVATMKAHSCVFMCCIKDPDHVVVEELPGASFWDRERTVLHFDDEASVWHSDVCDVPDIPGDGDLQKLGGSEGLPPSVPWTHSVAGTPWIT